MTQSDGSMTQDIQDGPLPSWHLIVYWEGGLKPVPGVCHDVLPTGEGTPSGILIPVS